MLARVDSWCRSVNYVINPVNRQPNSLQAMESLQAEAGFIPVIVSDLTYL